MGYGPEGRKQLDTTEQLSTDVYNSRLEIVLL